MYISLPLIATYFTHSVLREKVTLSLINFLDISLLVKLLAKKLLTLETYKDSWI
jgi:hypothetical protein